MRLLLLEHEKKIARFVARGLRDERFAVDVAPDGRRGLEMFAARHYDLVILDLNLPVMGGFEVLTRIRRNSELVLILALTARDSLEERVKYFEAGADDCLTMPFAFAELLVRAKALLRRAPVGPSSVMRVADLELNRLSQQVWRAGKPIQLTSKEYGLLEYLVSHVGRALSRTMIMEQVWDERFEGLTNIVDVYVRHLREKVDGGHPRKLIQTIRGVGYCVADQTKAYD